MILSKTVFVTLNPSNIKHYESLGYNIPRQKDNWNRLTIKLGTTIKVKIEHLLSNSNEKIYCKCNNCNAEKWTQYQFYLKYIKTSGKYLCKKCANSTDEHNKRISLIHKGKKFTEEHKRKISENHRDISGINNPMYGKYGKDNPNYNISLTDYDRQHHRKISGISTWKNQIKKRDNYTCRKCGSHEHLHVHHIKDYKHFKELRLDINNGATDRKSVV
jgi:DNA-directed RNA polymerase subunit M/transcription elongation factor TFIIS